jgi:hypothetical protein
MLRGLEKYREKKGEHKMKQEIHPMSYNKSRRKEALLCGGLYRLNSELFMT